jgi:hypothetical protein
VSLRPVEPKQHVASPACPILLSSRLPSTRPSGERAVARGANRRRATARASAPTISTTAATGSAVGAGGMNSVPNSAATTPSAANTRSTT